MDTNNTRYILMVIDTKHKDHEGRIFADLNEARRMAEQVLGEGYADKAAIGMFVMDPSAYQMHISHVETMGFQSDRTRIAQLELFKPHSHAV
jgi:hypothetical protein